MACNLNVGVILPASGSGERMGLTAPKQFSEMFGKPLFFYSIYCFHRLDWVKSIILTVSQDHLDAVSQIIAEFNLSKVKVIEGGSTRHRSIYKAVQGFSGESAPDVLIVHDAVRLFVTEELAWNVAVSAKKHGAAGVMRPLVSTVIATESNFLEESLDRNRYWASEMPQAFQYRVIKQAYEQSTDYDFDYGTECLLLATKYTGAKAYIVEGSSDLWKVTYRKDLHAAEGMLKEHYIRVQMFGTDVCKDLASHLQLILNRRRIQVSSTANDDIISTEVNTFVFFHQMLPPAVKRQTDQSITISPSVKRQTDRVVHSMTISPSVKWQTDRVVHSMTISPTVKQQTDRVVQLMNSKSHIPVLSAVVIHVFIGADMSCDLSLYLSHLSQLCKSHDVSVCGVVSFKDCRLEDISLLVTEIIWSRKQVFSGQLFTVRS